MESNGCRVSQAYDKLEESQKDFERELVKFDETISIIKDMLEEVVESIRVDTKYNNEHVNTNS